MKLHKQSSGVGKYLKWLKQKFTGCSLPNIHQQLKEDICPECHGEGWYPAGMNCDGQVKEDCAWCDGTGKRSSI
jgi:DnaJ-class molecular chaperone